MILKRQKAFSEVEEQKEFANADSRKIGKAISKYVAKNNPDKMLNAAPFTKDKAALSIAKRIKRKGVYPEGVTVDEIVKSLSR